MVISVSKNADDCVVLGMCDVSKMRDAVRFGRGAGVP